MDKFGVHADLMRAYDQPTIKSYGPRATMRRMTNNPAGTSRLKSELSLATPDNLPSFDPPKDRVIDLRN